ncbi:hypothetical protein FUT69_05265 [Xylella taiwanensis]|uniref:hypothetical protein n=1 Tax=Xylella taiwanensis TaxID=1444770 RepID=UPI00135F1913|nr:hypothetical protein [Xylella taiwanensis]MCD8467673.1 hypothetical protein [Xylella taiwanensis]NBI36599.1 hypothetical protein [Xylella taiwanensis]
MALLLGLLVLASVGVFVLLPPVGGLLLLLTAWLCLTRRGRQVLSVADVGLAYFATALGRFCRDRYCRRGGGAACLARDGGR